MRLWLKKLVRNRSLERLSEQVLDAFEINTVPVDVRAIAEAEGILLGDDDFGEGFYGRLEYHPKEQVFFLFHQSENFRNSFVVRFSIAHELGHYYIPEHRAILLRGSSHNSKPDFLSSNAIEREADLFAGALLIPERYLKLKFADENQLSLMSVLAVSKECQASAIASAIRCIRWSEEAIAAVVSENTLVKFCAASEEAAAFYLNWVGNGLLPESSVSRNALTRSANEILEGQTNTSLWFPNAWRTFDAWEEACRLGNMGLVLTLLHIDLPEDEDEQ